MDDITTGGETLEEVIALRDEPISILESGGLKLKKWASNRMEILSGLNECDCSISPTNFLNNEEKIKTLGIFWCPQTDFFQFSFDKTILERDNLTKREFLSIAAKIFDPLGLISPVTIILKQLFQNLSIKTSGTDWDDPLPSEVFYKWSKIKSQLKDLSEIRIPRWVPSYSNLVLHGFCDASTKSYAACIYLVSSDTNGNKSSNLLITKTKVAPVEQISIARLELCAALLLAYLVKYCKSCMLLEPDAIICYSDSQIVLCWLAAGPKRWKPFVSNRVKQIIEIIPHNLWRYVKSNCNPSDIASRGVLPVDLINNSFWWNPYNHLLIKLQ